MAELGGQLTPSVKGGGQGYISDPSPIIRDIDLVARDGCFSQALRSAFFYLKRTEMQDFVQNFLRGCHPRTATGGRGPPSFPYQPAVFSDSSNIFDAPRPLFPAADGPAQDCWIGLECDVWERSRQDVINIITAPTMDPARPVPLIRPRWRRRRRRYRFA